MARKYWLILLLVLLIATFFRFWKINILPPGLYPDEAINGNEALFRAGKIFYPENNGREGLFINLVFVSFSIFGPSILSLRIVSALIGTLTVLGLFLFTKELFTFSNKKSPSPERIALLASFFLSISFWHTNFSRIAFRGILLPFVLAFSFYFLFRAFNDLKGSSLSKKTYLWAIFGGLFFGLGFYTYTPFRMAVLILPFVFLFGWLYFKQQNLQKEFGKLVSLALFTIFLVALPLGIYFLYHPTEFLERAGPISIFSAQNPAQEFLRSLLAHLGMFNVYGDPNWRHNFSGSPQLFWPVGILFLIGLFLTFKEIFKKTNYQNKNYPLLTTSYLLSFTFLAMLLAGILTREGIPHALRTIGTTIPVYILAGLGGWQIYQILTLSTKNKLLLKIAIFLFLVALMLFQYNKYFVKWANKKEVKDAFSQNYVKMGEYLVNLKKGLSKYVIVNVSGVPVPYPNGIPMPAQTIMFIENINPTKSKAIYILPQDLDKIEIKKPAKVLIMRPDQKLLSKLLNLFPQGNIEIEKGPIFIYNLPTP